MTDDDLKYWERRGQSEAAAERQMEKSEREIELECRIQALEIETEALKKTVEYLLWVRIYSLPAVDAGDTRAEARGYEEALDEAWTRAAERR